MTTCAFDRFACFFFCQSILLLELFSVPASPAPPAIPSSLHRIPVFYAEVKSTNTDSDVHAWFRSNEKLLMQSLSLLGLGLNHEAIVSAASDATSEHQQPLLYSLLYHGAKVTRVSLLSDLLHDLFQLLSLPDVIDLEALDKQLVREMGLHECQRRFGASDPKDQEEEEAKSEEGDDTATAPQLAVTLRAKFRQPLDVVSTSSVADETADSFTLSLDGPHPSLSTPLHAASLRRTHSCLTDLDGELAVRLFIHHFVACHAAVAAAVDKQIGGDNESKDDSVAATTLASFLSGLTAHSSLASLLSPDTAAAKQPADFFRSLLAANRQLTRQRQQQQTQQDNSATGGA